MQTITVKCALCGTEIQTTKKSRLYCDDCRRQRKNESKARHKEAYAEYNKQSVERLKEEGKCISCRKPNDNLPKVYCLECTKRRSKQNREAYEWYIEHKVCVRCHKRLVYDGKTECEECGARDAERSLAYRKSNLEAVKEREHTHKRIIYHNRKESGLCTCCGQKAVEGRTKCLSCLAKEKVNRRKRYGSYYYETKREEWVREWRCVFCGEDTIPGRNICQRHYDLLIQKNLPYLDKYRRNQKERNGHEQRI